MLVPADDTTKIYSLLCKIKNLAEHPGTPANEAAAAALKYRELLLKYELSEGQIADYRTSDDFVRNRLKPCSKLQSWYFALAQVVAEFMGCAVVSSRTYKGNLKYELSFVGRTKDTWRTIDLFLSLAAGFKHAANYAYVNAHKSDDDFYCPTPYRFKTSFLHGCVVGLRQRIEEIEASQAEYAHSTALVVQKTAAADSFVLEVLKIKEGKQPRPVMIKKDAFQKGIQEGRRARILSELAQAPK
jgi:hypothetical protein